MNSLMPYRTTRSPTSAQSISVVQNPMQNPMVHKTSHRWISLAFPHLHRLVTPRVLWRTFVSHVRQACPASLATLFDNPHLNLPSGQTLMYVCASMDWRFARLGGKRNAVMARAATVVMNANGPTGQD